ncbi:MAG: hypothetical protein WAT67_13430, partial [Candidatus Contendobacter sp.]
GLHLLIAPRRIGRLQVGLVDHPRPPGPTRFGAFAGPARPAAFGDDAFKVFLEVGQGNALLAGFGYSSMLKWWAL